HSSLRPRGVACRSGSPEWLTPLAMPVAVNTNKKLRKIGPRTPNSMRQSFLVGISAIRPRASPSGGLPCLTRFSRVEKLSVESTSVHGKALSRFPGAFQMGATMKLTARNVAAAKLPPDKAAVVFWDENMPGFGYRMRQSGDRVLRSWIVQYRRGGASRRLLLGSAEVLGADQARAEARKALAKVHLGGDPQGERVAARNKAPEH